MDDVLRISGRTGAAADEEKGVDSVGDDHKEEVVAEVKLFVHLRSVYHISWNIITIIIVQMYIATKEFIQSEGFTSLETSF